MQTETVKDFENKTGYTLEVKDGELYYGGNLDLEGTGITQLPKGLTVGGYLDLRDTGITQLPEGLTVGGYLDLRGTGITQLPEGLTVGGNLDLKGTGITQLPEGLTVGDNLDLRDTGITQLPEGLTVGGNLDLEGTGITQLPEGLTVGGYLDLRGTGITQFPKGLTVGGYLDLEGTGITQLPEGLTVGGDIYIRGTGITDISNINRNVPAFVQWRNFEYIKVDGIFSKVISHKSKVYKIRQIGETEERFLITDGYGKWSHGDTLKEAKDDLIYKISNRDKSKYENLILESELTFAQAIEAYRVITGACAAGTKMFVKNVLASRKEKYTISEIIRLTKGQYNCDVFERFFEK